MHVLVHIDLDYGLGPIGAWGYDGIRLRHFYPESLDPAISARARDLMAQRSNDIPVDEWMALIAESDPSPLDSYEIVTADGAESLPAVLAQYRHAWSASASD